MISALPPPLLPVDARMAEKKPILRDLIQTPQDTLERDLSVFPLPMLQLLQRDHVKVVALEDGQSLLDTPASGALEPSSYQSRLTEATALIARSRAQDPAPVPSGDEFRDELAARQHAEALGRELSKQLPDFRVALDHEPLNLDRLAEQRDIEPARRPAWKTALLQLNGLTETGSGQIQSPDRVLVLPYTYLQGQPIAEKTLTQHGAVTAEEVEQALGKNYPEERSIVIYSPYLADPNSETGHYRIAIHELGHALDHALDRLPEQGPQHRARVDALYAHDKADQARGVNHFTSERAADSVREYFAEAVEAYFTAPMGDAADGYRTDNNRQELQKRNPELYAYVDQLMHTELPPSAVPKDPEPTPVPPGTPEERLETLTQAPHDWKLAEPGKAGAG